MARIEGPGINPRVYGMINCFQTQMSALCSRERISSLSETGTARHAKQLDPLPPTMRNN